MASLTVDVKWQKEMFKGIEIDTEQPPIVFKIQLFTLTGETMRCTSVDIVELAMLRYKISDVQHAVFFRYQHSHMA